MGCLVGSFKQLGPRNKIFSTFATTNKACRSIRKVKRCNWRIAGVYCNQVKVFFGQSLAVVVRELTTSQSHIERANACQARHLAQSKHSHSSDKHSTIFPSPARPFP